MAHLPRDIHQQILIRLSVRDLIRCKSVCKSWQSLISDPHFTKSHLDHSYQVDCNNDELGHRRIIMSNCSNYLMSEQYDSDNKFFDINDRHLLGSSNGLICVSPSPNEVLVINPSTREVNKLTMPKVPKTKSMCWGFGYDSSTDDYKVLLGFRKDENDTCFQVFSLRSNNWKDIGVVKYAFISSIGVLCIEALHFVAYDTSEKQNIICSFHLSSEKFQEVPQPDDARYQLNFGQNWSKRLGTMEGCLCIFQHEPLPHQLWVMKEYNAKESWEYFGCKREIKYDAVYSIKQLKSYISNKRSFYHELWSHKMWFCKNRVFVGVPLYVESLVSPHFHKRPERKRRATHTRAIKRPKGKLKFVVSNPIASTSFDVHTSPRAQNLMVRKLFNR